MAPVRLSRAFSRRKLIAALVGTGWWLPATANSPPPLQFPRDHGSHPGVRTEWWYLTCAARAGPREFGLQVTFFRARVPGTQDMKSAFAAKQLVFAHVAITDVSSRKLHYDQRIERAGFGIVLTEEDDMRLRIRDWQFTREPDGIYQADIRGSQIRIEVKCRPAQPMVLQGRDGLSVKGPDGAANYYYSHPQLQVSGRIGVAGQQFAVEGTGWLDHEWGDMMVHPETVGWDWVGMNLFDGSALMAFQHRRADASALWDGGSFRPAGREAQSFDPRQTRFTPSRFWTSAMSKARYPVEWKLECPAGSFLVRPLFYEQELDSRPSTGAIYWEGLSDLLDARGRPMGKGYLEMTGYASPLRF